MLGYAVLSEAPYVVFYDHENRGALTTREEKRLRMLSIPAEDMRRVYIEESETGAVLTVAYVPRVVNEGGIRFMRFTFDSFGDADRFAAEIRSRTREAGMWRRG